MSTQKCKLSIIMPVFNEELRISRAIESVIHQRVDFRYELIIVDDGSTDKTLEIAKNYQAEFPQIAVLSNEENRGKGPTFAKAYGVAAGQYFHVLDGDDFFISYDKLQRQVDFLDTNDDFVAVAHEAAVIDADRRVSFATGLIQEQVFDYEDSIKGDSYFHTSAIMYRKIHKELPSYFYNTETLRGDTAVFFYHVFHSKKNVMYFPDIFSVYHYHGAGLWSGLNESQKILLNRRMIESFRDIIVNGSDPLVSRLLDERISGLEPKQSQSVSSAIEGASIDQLLELCITSASQIYAPQIGEKAFRGMYTFRVADQLCELVGRLTLLQKGHLIKGRVFDEHKVAILISGLVPTGGGMFREIKELVSMFLGAGFAVDILSSNAIKTDVQMIKKNFDHHNIQVWQPSPHDSLSDQLSALIDAVHSSAPSRIYPFVTHHDAILSASLQKGLGGEIVIDYVYDHGVSLGILNSSIDYFIVKTASQASALARIIPAGKLRLVPPFLTKVPHGNAYKPFRNGSLTTASAAARSYKVEADYRYSYFDIVAQVLKITGGYHYHYGPLSRGGKDSIGRALRKRGIDSARFVHIEWESEFGSALLRDGIDIFLAPFPVWSPRIAIEVMSCGIPILNHNVTESLLPQAIDFVDPEQLTWDDPADLFAKLEAIEVDDLIKLSRSAREFFEKNNTVDVATEAIVGESFGSLDVPSRTPFALNDVVDAGLIELDGARLGQLLAAAPSAAIVTISIVVIAYNHERYIGAALESTLGQGAREIVVVDDGSTDATAAIARKFEGPGLTVLEKTHGGPGSALNYAIERTTGDMICLLSGDAVLLPGSILDRAGILSRAEADIVSSRPLFIDADNQLLPEPAEAAVFSPPPWTAPLAVFSELLFSGDFVCAPSVAMRRSCWKEVGRFNESLHQLHYYEYWLRASAKGFRILVAPVPFIFYRLYEAGLSLHNSDQDEREIVTSAAPDLLDKNDLGEFLFGEKVKRYASILPRRYLSKLLFLKMSIARSVRQRASWFKRGSGHPV